MGTRKIIYDDFDGAEPARTVRFDFGGTSYEIDLSGANEDRLRQVLAAYRPAARRAPRRGPRTTAHREDAARIRSWARSQGYPVADKGRIPDSVAARYH